MNYVTCLWKKITLGPLVSVSYCKILKTCTYKLDTKLLTCLFSFKRYRLGRGGNCNLVSITLENIGCQEPKCQKFQFWNLKSELCQLPALAESALPPKNHPYAATRIVSGNNTRKDFHPKSKVLLRLTQVENGVVVYGLRKK